MVHLRWTVAAVLLQLSSVAFGHGDDEHDGKDMGGMGGMKMGAPHSNSSADPNDWYNLPSYSSLTAHSRMMTAHIVFMVLAWFFILPIGSSHPSLRRSSGLTPIQVSCSASAGLAIPFLSNSCSSFSMVSALSSAQSIMSALLICTRTMRIIRLDGLRPGLSQPKPS